MLSLCWFSGHAKVDGNEKADLTPRAATQEGSLPERKLSPLKLIALKESTTKLSPGNGKVPAGVRKFIQSLDHALPGKHTPILYDGLCRS